MTPVPPPRSDETELTPVTVVVVAYGSPDELDTCLSTLRRSFPVVVIDNSSSPDVRAVAERAGAVYRDPGDNLGFAAGVNVALRQVDLGTGDVLLLNPDAVVEPDAVDALRAELARDAAVACVAPAQRHPVTGRARRVCWPFDSPGRAWMEALGAGRFMGRWDFVMGSVLLMRGRALQQIGAFDEGFFLYGEEADWEHRAVDAGWKTSYAPDVWALHVGGSTDADDERHRLRVHAAAERYLRKWHGPIGWRVYQVAAVLTALRRALRGKPDARRTSLRLAWLYLRGPYRCALAAGAVPARSYGIPPLG